MTKRTSPESYRAQLAQVDELLRARLKPVLRGTLDPDWARNESELLQTLFTRALKR